jgi:hypothetical protein
MSREGGRSASVRHIGISDNRGAGACIAAGCRRLGLKSRDKFRIKLF